MKRLILITISLLFLYSCDKTKTKESTANLEVINKINILGKRYLELNRFSGTILVSKNNEILYHDYFGLANYENNIPFNDSTAFKVGKLSKLITEDIINDLIKINKLKPNDNELIHIPNSEIDISIKYSENETIIIPETSLNHDIIRLIIESLANKKVTEHLKDYSLREGLTNTFFNDQNNTLATGYLFNNYRRLGNELHPSPEYNSNKIFMTDGIKSTAKDLLKIINKATTIDINDYIENDGFSYTLQNNPDTKTSIIILSNRKHPVTKEMANGISAVLNKTAYNLPLLRKPFNIDVSLLNSYVGRFSLNENMNFNVIKKNDSLFAILGPNEVYLIPQSSNQFYLEKDDAAMRFVKDSTGIVNQIILLNGFLDGDVAKRIE